MLKKLMPLLLLPLSCAFAEANGHIESVIKALLEQFQGSDKSSEEFTITSHTMELPTGRLEYKAIVGTLDQYANSGDVAGKMFFTAYIKETEEKNRPVTFIFNGGPGGSSLSMHIGGLGPRRLLLPEEGQKILPPYKLVDNQETMLNTSDLVFVDPIGTGYSQATREEYKQAYYGVEGDLFSFTEFIRMFCIHFERWNSPKYLMGASYGTCRACGLSESLAQSGIYLNGVILLSCALDYGTLVSQRDSWLADSLRIPSFAATSWFHGKTMQDRSLSEVVEYARRFTSEEYIPAMIRSSRLGVHEQNTFYQKLSDLIGLPESTLRRSLGRVQEDMYMTEFLSPSRKTIGGIDSRYIGDISGIYSETTEDPSYKDIRPAFYPAFLHYMRSELETQSDFPKYTAFSTEAFLSWNWWTYDNPLTLPNFLQRLRRTLVINPAMKVFVGSGYYDIRTPFAAAEYSIDHLDLPETYKNNFQIQYYEAGHGFIFDLASLKKFKVDLDAFYAN